MRRLFLALLSLCLLPLGAAAQSPDRANTILVLDGSGSMWGQIDGINKIVIAREVIADLLADMPDDQSLGLTVYGHRQRGSCTDIETIVAPAPFTQDEILSAVNAINPRGRTPMTDAVVAAAQSLRHTEEPATVILVSDGIENCNPDPCAMAAELEAAGIGFTAHVIGFDVASEPEARAQMQCIADNTGGLFLTADNAAELSAALQQVTMAPPAAPAVTATPLRIEARLTPSGAVPTRAIGWTLLSGSGEVLDTGAQGPAITAELMPGDYIARATRAEEDGPVTYQTAFAVTQGMPGPVVVAMPEIVEAVPVTFTARVEPDMTVPASPLVWSLFDATGQQLLGPVEAPGGNVALLPGDYRLSVTRVTQETTHEATFAVAANTPQEVVVPLPVLLVDVTLSARIGGASGPAITDPVLWEIEGRDAALDTTNPVTLGLSRGAYRVTAYWTAQEIEESVDFVIVDQPREVAVIFPEPQPRATITAPASAVAGSTVEVGWTGPDNRGDYIGIGRADGEGSGWVTYAETDSGTPVTLLMPIEAGDYLIRYFLRDGRTPIASAPITVTPVAASITAPESAVAGSTIEVGWTGPDYQGDYIGIGRADGQGSGWENYANTRDGTPLQLLVPETPGDYLISYYARQDRTRITAVPITVTPVAASITAPDSAVAGSTIEVGWTGPDYQGDYIGIGRADGQGSAWENYVDTREGSPVQLRVPETPGDYLIQYFLRQDRTAIASVPVTVTAAEATVTAPGTAIAGQVVEVAWTGPDYEGDYIGIGRSDGQGSAWANYAYTRDGTPAQLTVPPEPGDYLVQYFMAQDRTPIASTRIVVSSAAASLTAPAGAVAGDTIEIGWTGPNYDGDYIGIGRADGQGSAWANYAYTRDGSPVQLLMPPEGGAYVIRYFIAQDRTPIAEVPITLSPVEASLTAPATAQAGTTIEVGWTGPDYAGDYIGIGRADGQGSGWTAYVYTRDGNPARLVLPDTSGAYVLRYFVAQDRTPVAEVPITLLQ
ncbi:von Willebrand factor type A domain protein [Roseibacterium elongatum DSM 19469]|uniref:von Willebrand factor type A domain protein n=1 Tax=Roseicyclus elongatus DSM 19469 TaxID=1294273 RepID=W8S7N9_9RHOB|nr:VWA domain-containing protein [Roseibacterium elongatum]AHM04921.1 von Willebrand factor type A domain protein [Roseibacterium elongatum DSM 19469]